VRAFGAAILGYLVMFMVVFVTFTAAYIGMGSERAFQPGTYDVTGLWLATSIVLGLLAAMAGGWVAEHVGKGGRASRILMIIVLVLGIASAIPAMMRSTAPTTREGAVSNLEAMSQARSPKWIDLLNPMIGIVGVMLGARLKRGSGTAGSSETKAP
jgi:hypothetical protein